MKRNHAKLALQYQASRIKRKFWPSFNLSTLAETTKVLHPSEEDIWPEALYLEDNLQFAKSSFQKSLENTIHYATATKVQHDATRLLTIPNVIYTKGCIYADRNVTVVGRHNMPTREHTDRLDQAVLTSTPSGAIFFGDWVLTDNILDDISSDMGIPAIKAEPILSYPHRPAICSLLGINETPPDELLYISKFHTVLDIGYNKHKMRRLRCIRSNLRDAQAFEPVDQPVFLERGKNSKSRGNITNEEELYKFLDNHGFKIVDPSDLTFEEALAAVFDSPLVMGIEGSQLAYGFLGLRPGGAMIALQPPHCFQSSFRPRCISVGLQWGFIVGQERRHGFRIPLDDITELFESAKIW